MAEACAPLTERRLVPTAIRRAAFFGAFLATSFFLAEDLAPAPFLMLAPHSTQILAAFGLPAPHLSHFMTTPSWRRNGA
jgi:hypothetical protein